jgi:hypothetical protein
VPFISIDWLVDFFFTVLRPVQEFFTRMETSPLPWRAAKFRPMLGSQGLWAGRNLYRATPAVTRDFGFSGLIRRTAQFSRLLRHMGGCRGSILTRILMGSFISSSLGYMYIKWTWLWKLCWLIWYHRYIWMYGWRTRLVYFCYYLVTVSEQILPQIFCQ